MRYAHLASLSWIADSFATRLEHRADQSILLRPVRTLGEFPARLMDSLEHWARTAPDRIFLARRGRDGSWVQVTYAQMLARVRRVAGGLIDRELSADRPIAILSGNSIEHLVLAFAAMWVGIPYCPVSPAYSQAAGELSKLRHALELLTPGLIAAFDTSRFARALGQVPENVEVVGDASVEGRRVSAFETLEREGSTKVDVRHSRTSADSIVKFLLTSGSMGQPKAVITTNRMCCSNAAMLKQAFPFVSDEPPVLVDWLPWNHTFGGTHNVGLVVTYGGTLYIDDGRPTPNGMQETVRNLKDISPTLYFNVPKGFELLAESLQKDPALSQTYYRRLRAQFFAGASLAQHTWDALDSASIRETGVKVPMLSGLGATETGPSVTFTTPAVGRAGVIGLPAAGAVVKLAPVEEKLEIRVRGPGVTPGYWRQPELTAQAFDSEGYYRLGDAVRPIHRHDPSRGLKFDGRIGEDFKLANGTWVSVGPLRADLITALAPVAQDIVLAGLNKDFVSAIVIADLKAASELIGAEGMLRHQELAKDPRLVEWLQTRLLAHAQANSASSRCIRRALILPSAPSLDRGEITDKGSINQRAILGNYSWLIDDLYAARPAARVALIDLQER